MINDQPLIFLDIETTGLLEHSDLILEVCAEVWTDIDDPHPYDRYEAVIKPERLPKLDPYVFMMHSKSGLLDELENGETARSVFDTLEDLFQEHPKATLAGRNVGTFDRKFLEAKRPGISRGLSYRHFDLSSQLLLFKAFGGFEPPGAPDAHRAAADVRGDVVLTRQMRDWIQSREARPFV